MPRFTTTFDGQHLRLTELVRVAYTGHGRVFVRMLHDRAFPSQDAATEWAAYVVNDEAKVTVNGPMPAAA